MSIENYSNQNRTNEIGSEFWVNHKDVNENGLVPKWLLKYGNVILTSSGRGAITHILNNVQLKNKTVLLPTYICESVIKPFVEYGYKCLFYGIMDDLNACIDDLLNHHDIGFFLHMGYFGYPTNHQVGSIIKKFKDNYTVIIEDVTHTLFSSITYYNENDFYIGSIRKWMGIPDGGFVASTRRKLPTLSNENKVFASLRLDALRIKGEFITSGNYDLKNEFLAKFNDSELLLDNDINPYAISDISSSLLNGQDVELICRQRRLNYNHLYDNLNNLESIRVLLPKANQNICPLFFPILIPQRDLVRKKLIEKDIYCPIHWSKSEMITDSDSLYDNELSIPCDQRYDTKDMDKIISNLKTILSNL